MFVSIFRCLDIVDLLSFIFLAIFVGFSGRSSSISFCLFVMEDLGIEIVGSFILSPVVSSVRYTCGIPAIPDAM